MKLKKSDFIAFGIMAILLAVAIAVDVLAGMWGDVITMHLYGSGQNLTEDNKELTAALSKSRLLNYDIAEEGVVLVKNEDETLPLSKDEIKKINIFGWSSSDGGWVCGSDGSAASNDGVAKNKLKMNGILQMCDKKYCKKCGWGNEKKATECTKNDCGGKEFVDYGIEYNQELATMYKNFCSSRALDGKGNLIRALTGDPRYYLLTEPAREKYDEAGENGKTILQNAKEFSDIALVVISRLGGEGVDLPFVQYKNLDGTKPKVTDHDKNAPEDPSRTYLDITTEEEALLKMVTENFKKVIVLYNSCNEMNLSFLDDYDVDAALISNGLGENGIFALPALLTGDANPSGKTTNTHAYDLTYDSTFVNAAGKTLSKSSYVIYQENVYSGYKWYETADKEGYWADYAKEISDRKGGKKTLTGYDAVVQYPFGYGLSYTDFKWEIAEFTPAVKDGFKADTEFTVKVNVTNVGDKPGKDTVELYATPPYYEGGVEKSDVNLVAFKKTALIPAGETQTVELTFSAYDMASYDCYDKNYNRNCGYELDFGEYVLSLRTDSHTVKTDEGGNPLQIKYSLDKTLKIMNDPTTGERVANRLTDYDVISKNSEGVFETTHVEAYAECQIDASDSNVSVTYMTRADFKGTFPSKAYGKPSGEAVTRLKNYRYDGEDGLAQTYKQGEDNGLYLYVREDGSKASKSDLESWNVKPNHELLMEFGTPANFDSEKWEKLLNQLSDADMGALISRGGYRTVAVESVGKRHMLENDGPAGLNRHILEVDKNVGNPDRTGWTMFSMPAVLGCTWNNDYAYAFGNSVGAEAIPSNVTGWYSPGANIQRSPFSGRNCEYYSEDAYLSGIMAAETCLGAESQGLNVYVKHFVANDQEANRISANTWATEQTLREGALKVFEIAVKKGKANGVMTALGCIGSGWVGGNYALIEEIMRGEWGFKGCIITDSYSGYMNISTMLAGGNDLALSTGNGDLVGINGDNQKRYYARKACKNILYASANAYYMHETRDTSRDIITVNLQKITKREVPVAWWMYWGVLPINVIIVAGIVVWTAFIIKKNKQSAAKNQQ